MYPGDEAIFALDIGTRTVIGIVAEPAGEGLRILAQAVVEHASRAMYDGQIHDIPRVAEAVAQVKESLEKTLETGLRRVAVAAAGRALKTTRARAEQEIDPHREIGEAEVRSLELMALAAARDEMSRLTREQGLFYCAGHSAVTYTLDGLPVSNLLGHRGRAAGVEVVATFLPASVVDSLLAVLRRAGLEPLNLTLEPIAAIDVAIPEGMRLLNLALVDIGAGTSDIAITREGAVVAYGMVPVAGDEVTEAIVEACLVDFAGAEAIKRRLCDTEEIPYTDILGNPNTVRREELLAAIEPVLDRLAGEVAREIERLNGGPPRSVLCVGGGCRVPTLTARIGEKLKLPPRLVGIKDRRMLGGLVAPEEDPLAGPEGVTVVGIATVTLRSRGYVFLDVTVNGTPCRLFNSGQLVVADGLSAAGFDPRLLLAKNGADLRFNLNGRPEIVRGELGRPASVSLNGQPAHLRTPLADGDVIEVVPARNGRDARAFVRDFLPPGGGITVFLEGRTLFLEPVCTLNDVPAAPEAEIHADDHLWIDARWTVEKLARREGLDLAGRQVLVNGAPAAADHVLTDGDRITFAPAGAPDGRGVTVTVNGAPVVLTGCRYPILVDIFNYIDLEPADRQRTPRILLNGREAAYTDPLKDGDVIELAWEEPWA